MPRLGEEAPARKPGRSRGAVVMGLEDGEHAIAAEFGRDRLAAREHRAQPRARDAELAVVALDAGPARGVAPRHRRYRAIALRLARPPLPAVGGEAHVPRRHAPAVGAIERVVELQGPDGEAPVVDLVEYAVRVVGPVVAAEPGMVAPHHQVRAPEILAEEGMQQRLARAGVAHLDGVAGLDHPSCREVVGDQPVDGADPDIGRDVALLERTQDLMNEQPVAHLDGGLGEELVTAVHGVAGLEGGDRRPALLGEQRPGFGGAQVKPPVGLGKVALGEDLDRTCQVDGALRHDLGDAGVGRVGGAVDLTALEVLVDGVSLGDREDAEDLPACVRQRHLVADGDGEIRAAGKRDGQRPEEPALQAQIAARAAPVGRAHETRQRRVGAHGEHEEVRDLAARERQPFQGARPLQRLAPLVGGQQQGFQGDAAVRGDQRRHGPSASLDSIAQAMIVVRNRG